MLKNKKGAFLGIVPLAIIILAILVAIGWIFAGTYMIWLIVRNFFIGGGVTYASRFLLGLLSKRRKGTRTHA